MVSDNRNMKKTLVFATILAIVVSIGLVIYGKHNRSEPQIEVLTEESVQTNVTEFVSGVVRVVPMIGTNIAKPGQFPQQQ
jgi:hypothetical protein